MSARVSVIVPCYNERSTITRLLEGLSLQTYPKEAFEVIVADGMSSDGTLDAIQEYLKKRPGLNLSVVEVPIRSIPAAVNLAVDRAVGDVIIRLDAHSVPESDYIQRCLDTLERIGAANAGGLWVIKASNESWIAAGIAVAAAHPIGAGDARYRTGGAEGEVDTVPFGAYPREWLKRIGPFNERLLTNEDYEYNSRIRAAGGMVWFDPSIRSIYYSRGTLRALARQYARYGFWKMRMLRSFPETLRWRQALPPLFVIISLFLLIVSPFSAGSRMLLFAVWGLYLTIMLAIGIWAAFGRQRAALALGMPLALITMHLFWGWGAVRGIFDLLFRSSDTGS